MLFILFLILFQGCKERTQTSVSSVGRPYQILVVLPDGESHSLLASMVKRLFSQPERSLPQLEPMFGVSLTTQSKLIETQRLFRNIFIVNVNPDEFTSTKLHVATDVASCPQLVVELQSPSIDECQQYVSASAQKLLSLFSRREMELAVRRMEKDGTHRFSAQVDSVMKVSIALPSEIDAIRIDGSSIWLSSRRMNAMNICLYTYPYVSEQVFSVDSVETHRNKALSSLIRGTGKNSSMSTVAGTVTGRNTSISGAYAYRASGLWQMEGEPMGGPFVSYSIVDTLRARVVVAEGFVYAPEKQKLPLVRRLEASVNTLRIIDN